MSSVYRVPETTTLVGELDAEDAAAALRRYGRAALLRESWARFRYGDGFSHARALGLLFCLALVPMVIALVGLSSTLDQSGRSAQLAEVLRRTLLSLVPGSSGDVVEQTLRRPPSGTGGTVALVLGLLTALVVLTSAMAQAERGANRIYGITRDRPTAAKYGRALLLSFGAGVPAVVGFLLVVGGSAAARSAERVYGVSPLVVQAVSWPLGVLLVVASVTLLLRHAPRRRQPGWSWLALGAGVALVLWLVFTGLLAVYVQLSGSFGTVYGPLTGIIALLLWAQLTSVALLLGIAVAAQLEAVHAGLPVAAPADPEAAPRR